MLPRRHPLWVQVWSWSRGSVAWPMSPPDTLQAGDSHQDPLLCLLGCAKAAPGVGRVQHRGCLQKTPDKDPAPTPHWGTPIAVTPLPSGASQAQPGQGATKQLLPRRGYKKPCSYCWCPRALRGQARGSQRRPGCCVGGTQAPQQHGVPSSASETLAQGYQWLKDVFPGHHAGYAAASLRMAF